MAEDTQAVLLGIVYGDDERISPADRVRAAELLERTSGEGEPTVRGVLRSMSDAEVAAAWDHHFAGELRGLLRGEAKDMPHTAEVLRELIEARAEERARELADADRIEREIEERANQRAEELYRERSFQLVRVTDASRPSDPPAQPPGRVEESAAPQASTAPPPGMDLRAGWPRRGGGRDWRRWPHE